MELRARGWSVRAAAREVGVSRSAATNWTRGYKTYRNGVAVGFVPPLDRLAVREIDAGGLHMLMVHGSPWNHKSEYIYPEYGAFERFDDLGYDCVILGHTHVPMVIETATTLIINPGSVGEPVVQDPRPSFAVLDTEERRAEIHTIPDYVETKRVRSVTPFRWGRSMPEDTARAWGIEIKK